MRFRTEKGTQVLYGVVRFGGGRETLAPSAVGLKTISCIILTGQAVGAQGIPFGSLVAGLKGTIGAPGGPARYGVLQGRRGSSVQLVWKVGSGINDVNLGSVRSGSGNAYFNMTGEN